MKDDEYLRFCAGVERLSGLQLARYRRNQTERRARTFAQRAGASDLDTYLLRLHDTDELRRFLDHVTINVSQLWRNPEQWEHLANVVLPELGARGPLRAWSAGCSYGAEAYSLAALCADLGVTISIRATDIDVAILAAARVGRFSEADVRAAPRKLVERWFDHGKDGSWTARPALRSRVRFAREDLLAVGGPPPLAIHDLVMCRNVVIYFDAPARDTVHRRLAAALRAGGYLLVGSTERIAAPGDLGLELVRPFLYRKRA